MPVAKMVKLGNIENVFLLDKGDADRFHYWRKLLDNVIKISLLSDF